MSEISLQQAYRLLGAAPTDSKAELKKKYHRAIRRCHPDADPEHQEKAHLLSQKINGAYHLILESHSPKPEAVHPQTKRHAAENPAAFCPRILFEGSSFYETFHPGHSTPFGDAFGGSDQSETIYGRMSEGRYFWDPDHESFALFMLSVHRKCQELVHSPEAELRLFHLMLQEYIRPWTCLTKIASENPEIRAEGNGFHIPFEISVSPAQAAVLATASEASAAEAAEAETSADGRSESGEEPVSVRVDHDRIHLLTRDGLDLGHITFLQDSLYVVVFPLLSRRCIRACVRPVPVRRKTADENARKASAKGGFSKGRNHQKTVLHFDLYLYDPMPVTSDRPANNSLEIAALLRADA